MTSSRPRHMTTEQFGYSRQSTSSPVVERQYERGEGPGTGTVAIGRHRQTQGVMRAMVVIAIQPSIECLLGLVEIAEGAVVEQLGLERSVKALVLAVVLRMIWSAVPRRHAMFDQPDIELGERLFERLSTISPVRTETEKGRSRR